MSLREEDNDYLHVVARVDETTRVIECRNQMQWIVQRRVGNRWRGFWFCRTKEALLRGCAAHPDLAALPDRFVEPARATGSVVGAPRVVSGRIASNRALAGTDA